MALVPEKNSLPALIGECKIIPSASSLGEREWICEEMILPRPTAIDENAGLISATLEDDSIIFSDPNKYKVLFSDPDIYTVTWVYDDTYGNTFEQEQTIVLQAVAHVGKDQAFTTIKDGLNAVTSGEKVKVAEGEYYEDTNIIIKEGVSLEGGWDPNFTIRDSKNYETIISGSRLVFIDLHDVSLDGFIIESGNAGCPNISNDGTVDDGSINKSLFRSSRSRYPSEIYGNIASCGGGIYIENSSPVISNCAIRYNRALHAGGGIYCLDSFPTIIDCIIAKNESDYLGGGICSYNSTVAIVNSTISENIALNAGGIACEDSTFLTLTNCTVWENEASHTGGNGGGIGSQNSSLNLLNVTFWGNSAFNSGAVFSKNSLLAGRNSIFWKDSPNEIWCDSNANCTVTYCVIEGGFGDPNFTHNINEDPLFEDANSGNFHLFSGLSARSPCIDAGTDTNAPIVDKNGIERPYDGDCDGEPITDIGAYEYVDDQEPVPDIDPLPDILANDKVILDPPTAIDNCRGPITGSTDEYIYYEKGLHTVTWTYDDENGNIRQQEQKVIIEDILFVGTGQLYATIQEAIENAESGDKIKVTSNTYGDSNNTTIMGKTIRFEGGWDTDFSQRDPVLYPTILIGQGTGAVISFIDSNHSVLDGFAIEGSGAAYGSGIKCINSSPTISNCIISGNNADYGGGIYCENSSPFITRCFINNNTANNNGGGVYWSGGSQPTILNCIFCNNTAQGISNHICKTNNHDIQLVRNGDFERIFILRYDNISDMGKSCYRFFEKPCQADLIIQDDDRAVISFQP